MDEGKSGKTKTLIVSVTMWAVLVAVFFLLGKDENIAVAILDTLMPLALFFFMFLFNWNMEIQGVWEDEK